MEEQTKNLKMKNEDKPDNEPTIDIPKVGSWKTLIIGFIILGIIYAGFSIAIHKGVFRKDQTVYCAFNREIAGNLRRQECGLLKIVTKDIDKIDFVKFKNETFSTICTNDIRKIARCQGESYNFLKYKLSDLCTIRPCNVRGVVCGAYYITYDNSSTKQLRDNYEEFMFTNKSLASEDELLTLLYGCGTT